mgnify:CR=1 FL=1
MVIQYHSFLDMSLISGYLLSRGSRKYNKKIQYIQNYIQYVLYYTLSFHPVEFIGACSILESMYNILSADGAIFSDALWNITESVLEATVAEQVFTRGFN